MHIEAFDGFDAMLCASGIDPTRPWSVLDVGGQDVNGTVHTLLPNAVFTTLDLEGADITGDARSWRSGDRWDLVIATEVFEHIEDWRAVLATMAYHLDPTGPELLIATCASTGRRPHGATGALDPAPGEWYRNVSPAELGAALTELFTVHHVRFSDVWGDAYMWARYPR